MFHRGSKFRGPMGPPHIGPRGLLRFFILWLLKEAPRSGYDLMKVISTRTYGAWCPSSGVIYPTLMELEDGGLIEEMKIQEGKQKSERGRKTYKITKNGEELLKQWEEQRHEFISKTTRWRRFLRSLWTPTLEEAIEGLQESIEMLYSLSNETKELPKEKLEATKKTLKDASKRLDALSKKLQI